ncbi:MAG: actin-binding WH2 domain-containing protein [Chloroflexota bacterium]
MKDLTIIETILRNRNQFFIDIRNSHSLNQKLRAMLLSNLLFFAIYGCIMGANHSFAQALSSAVKLPILFLVTLIICAPSLYFFNIFYGSDQSIQQNLSLILTSMTVTAILLLSLAPITFFFWLTTSEYQFFKLLNVAIFSVAGFMGVSFLAQGMSIVSPEDWSDEGLLFERQKAKPAETTSDNETDSENEGPIAEKQAIPPVEAKFKKDASNRRLVLRLWMLLYGFVGSQLAWTLRPFVGSPDVDFQIFREMGGNFYSNVLGAIAHILGFQ